MAESSRVVLGEAFGASGNGGRGATGAKAVVAGGAGKGSASARAHAAVQEHMVRLARSRGSEGAKDARTTVAVVPPQLAATALPDAPPRLSVLRSTSKGALGVSSVGSSLPGAVREGEVLESAAQGKLRLAPVPPPRVPSAETRARLAADMRRVSSAALSERLRRVRKHIIHAQAELTGTGGATWAAKHHLQTALGAETEVPVPGGWPMGVSVRVLVEEAQTLVRDFPRSEWSTPARLGAAALVVHTYAAMIEARKAFHDQPFHAPLHRVVDIARADFAAALAKFQEASVLAEREEAARKLARDQRLRLVEEKAEKRARRRRRRLQRARFHARQLLAAEGAAGGAAAPFPAHDDLERTAVAAAEPPPVPLTQRVLVDFGLDEEP